jgi:hypothetical protein
VRLGELPPVDDGLADAAAALYLDHRFDLLGSGWVRLEYGMICAGLEGHRYPPGPAVVADPAGDWLRGQVSAANLAESRRIWGLVEPPYAPIDWQLDFKSGFRWSALTYFTDIRYGDRPGADVKLPWELARLQHLPQLALAYRRADSERRATYRREFRNQVLDFIAANPPQFGVNWTCAMDVAIRAANILLAFDLFHDAGATFDESFAALVKRSAGEHARHIIDNLEWSETGRGNHYLSDIVGLLFIAAYLPRSATTNSWLAFAAAELAAETAGQFFPDGGNIEASTSYHRLSGELVAFGAALLLGLASEEIVALAMAAHLRTRAGRRAADSPVALPETVFRTLRRAARLTRDATRSTGQIVQWGDNDSGRLFKLSPCWSGAADGSLREDGLDHRGFVAAVAALTGDPDLAAWAGPSADAAIVAALAGGRVATPDAAELPLLPMPALDFLPELPETVDGPGRRLITIPVPLETLTDLRAAAYPAFGHYVLLGERFFLAIRCPGGPGGRGPGHAHDDALALVLQVDRCNPIDDPGTFVYTPLPAERDRYRAASAHFAPRVAGHRSADLSAGLFAISGLPRCRCVAFGPRGFVGEIQGNGWGVRRVVAVRKDHVVVFDEALGGALAPLPEPRDLPPVCSGYGVKTGDPPRSV